MKLTATFGRKVRTGDYETMNIELMEEYDSTEISERDALDKLKAVIDERALVYLKSYEGGTFPQLPVPKPTKTAEGLNGYVEPSETPKKKEGMEQLKWKSYKRKDEAGKALDADSDEDGWVLSEYSPPDLVNMVEQQGTVKLDIGSHTFEVKFSKNPQFLNRKLVR